MCTLEEILDSLPFSVGYSRFEGNAEEISSNNLFFAFLIRRLSGADAFGFPVTSSLRCGSATSSQDQRDFLALSKRRWGRFECSAASKSVPSVA
jgi:hypothetical protein